MYYVPLCIVALPCILHSTRYEVPCTMYLVQGMMYIVHIVASATILFMHPCTMYSYKVVRPHTYAPCTTMYDVHIVHTLYMYVPQTTWSRFTSWFTCTMYKVAPHAVEDVTWRLDCSLHMVPHRYKEAQLVQARRAAFGKSGTGRFEVSEVLTEVGVSRVTAIERL